jgi:hypothetical protein
MLREHPACDGTPKNDLWCFFGVPSLRRQTGLATFIDGRRDWHCEKVYGPAIGAGITQIVPILAKLPRREIAANLERAGRMNSGPEEKRK